MDYTALNNLLPPVTKAHSKTKGVLIPVPLVKMNEIDAQLTGPKFYSTLDLRSGYYHIVLSAKM